METYFFKSAIHPCHTFFLLLGNMRMNRNQFRLILRQKSVKYYPSRKLKCYTAHLKVAYETYWIHASFSERTLLFIRCCLGARGSYGWGSKHKYQFVPPLPPLTKVEFNALKFAFNKKLRKLYLA